MFRHDFYFLIFTTNFIKEMKLKLEKSLKKLFKEFVLGTKKGFKHEEKRAFISY
tara:strand:+ start:2645 stop:2806 length:162 start_codon:yes stop_codon:yes gene_type:complete